MRTYVIRGVDGEIVNTVVADQAFIDAHFPDAEPVPEPEPAAPAPDPTEWLIDVGAFFDRFGPLKWAILADTNPQVQAVVKDASVRSYIDLDNADLPAGLALMQAAGHAIDAEAIIDAPVGAGELP